MQDLGFVHLMGFALTVFVKDSVTTKGEDKELRKHFILMDGNLIKQR